MKALIITKQNIDNKKKKVSTLLKELDKRKITYQVVDYDDVDEFYSMIHEKGYKNTFDILISFGGDGTILKSARVARKLDIPILGINVGTVGFLTSVDSEKKIGEALDKIKKKDYLFENRFMLQVEVIKKDKTLLKAYAVNECTVSTTNLRKTAKYRVSVNDKDKVFNEYRANGIIVATPTGSTAYSLSAGGPIVAPNVDCLILTAVCPHSFNQRSIVISAEETIYINVENDEQIVDVDGRVECDLEIGDIVKVSKLNKIVRYITFEKDHFLNNIKSKIKSI